MGRQKFCMLLVNKLIKNWQFNIIQRFPMGRYVDFWSEIFPILDNLHPSKTKLIFINIREHMNMLSFSKETISILMITSLTFEKLQDKSSMIWLPSIPNLKKNPTLEIQNWIDNHLKLLLKDSKNTSRQSISIRTVST